MKSLSLGFYRTSLVLKRGFGRAFLEGSIGLVWGGRRCQGTVLKFPLYINQFEDN